MVALKEAILAYTDGDGEVKKPGLKTGIYYLITESVKKCIGNALAEENDEFAKELGNFLVLLQHRKDEVTILKLGYTVCLYQNGTLAISSS